MDKQKQFIINFLYISLLSIALILFLKYVLIWILPLLIAILLATLLHSLSKHIEKHLPISYKTISILLYLLFILMFIFTLFMIGVQLYEFIQNTLHALPLLYSDHLQPFIININHQFQDRYNHFHPLVADSLTLLLNSSQDWIHSISSTLLASLSHVAKNIPSFLFNVLLTLLLTFLITIDYEKLILQIKQTFPSFTKQLKEIKYIIQTTFTKLIKAHLILMMMVFIQCIVGFYLLKLDNLLLLASLFAFCDLLPFIGVGIIFIPWILFELIAGSSTLAIGLLILYLVITTLKNIAENQLVGKAIGIHPLFLLLAMILGGKFFGLIGILTLPFVLVIISFYLKKTDGLP